MTTYLLGSLPTSAAVWLLLFATGYLLRSWVGYRRRCGQVPGDPGLMREVVHWQREHPTFAAPVVREGVTV